MVEINFNSSFNCRYFRYLSAESSHEPSPDVGRSGVVRLRQLLHGQRKQQPTATATAKREKCDSGEGPQDREEATQRPRLRWRTGHGKGEGAGKTGYAKAGETRREREQVMIKTTNLNCSPPLLLYKHF